MGPNLNPKRIRVREQRMVQETPDAASSKSFENGSSVAPRDFKAAKGWHFLSYMGANCTE
jgi:hypothetical protein